MEKLREYLKALTNDQRVDFAARCNTSIGYLRKVLSTGQRIGEATTIAIDRESGGAVRCEDLRPDVDWVYLRGTAKCNSRKAS